MNIYIYNANKCLTFQLPSSVSTMERCSKMRTEFCSILGGSTHLIKFGQLPDVTQHAPYIFLVFPGTYVYILMYWYSKICLMC